MRCIFKVRIVLNHLQFRAKLIFLILTNDDNAVGIDVKSLSLISKILRP